MIDESGIFWPDHEARETRWTDLEDRVREFWHLEPLPRPRFRLPVACPGSVSHPRELEPGRVQLGHEALWVPRLWRYFLAPEASSYRPRCKVRFKCGRCSLNRDYAIAVPREHYQQRHRDGLIRWREAKREFQQAGILPG